MYYIAATDVTEYAEFENLDQAKEHALALAIEHGIELDVVDSDTGNVAHVATPVQGRHFHPWERVETPKFPARHIPGYRPAYTRKRINTVVYRNLSEPGWLVVNGDTGEETPAPTTAAARAITNRMAQEA